MALALEPIRTLVLDVPGSGAVETGVSEIDFASWAGEPIADTYGGKPVVEDRLGQSAFAELAILRELEAAGWKGVWVDSYRRRLLTGWPPVAGQIDRSAARVFDRISQLRRGRSWDVYAWCADKVLFVESKRRGKDAIRPTQIEWLAAGLASGLSMESFLVAEWSIVG